MPEATATPAVEGRQQSWTKGWIDLWIESPPFRLLLIAVELSSFIVGAVSVYYAAQALDVANETRRDQQVSEARQMLLNPPPGLFDIGEAARTILSSGRNLTGLQLNCGTGLVARTAPGPRCQPTMYIGEIELLESPSKAVSVADLPPRQTMRYVIERSQFDGVNFYDSTFDGVGLFDARFYSSNFSRVAFNHCRIESSVFNDAYIEDTSFENCEISSSSFAGADLRRTSFEGTSMFEVNISGATLCSELNCVSGLTTENLAGMYYFDDDPPILTGLLVPADPKVCPAASRANMVPGGVANCGAPVRSVPNIPAPGQDFPSSETGGT
ncbi:pentapeptide repeat-containing protein [Devosia sp.]|uniref:pentapeptide repeat-containing protein n=1 Tax=Devosia sp. TaxID=1871048 RepID=UPI003BACEFAC